MIKTGSLIGKTALITGAGNGIGQEMALLFSREGARVIVADINNIAGEKTLQQLRERGGEGIYIHANIARPQDCEALYNTANQFGQLDIIVNNAGIMHPNDGDITALDEKVWDMTMSINLKGAFLICKYGIPILLQAKHNCSIINISSFVALRGSAKANMAYSVSKAGLIALTQDLAAKYATSNIRVNAICPGPTLTSSFEHYLTQSPQLEKEYLNLNLIPMRRFAQPADIAQAALFLASDNSCYMTGSIMVVDGGTTACYDH